MTLQIRLLSISLDLLPSGPTTSPPICFSRAWRVSACKMTTYFAFGFVVGLYTPCMEVGVAQGVLPSCTWDHFWAGVQGDMDTLGSQAQV